jgi:UDP-glucose:(heptosyl)LPS alpha-1,3-glucosyltransferase
VHGITTFHCQPFATVREKPWWKRISLRVAMQLYLEWRELSVARIIVPNSAIIREQLQHYYPQFVAKITFAIEPGVVTLPRQWHSAPKLGGVIAFIGVEWKRKGLPLAIRIVEALRNIRPDLQLWAIGSEVSAIQHKFAAWNGGYRLMGWRSDKDYLREVDVLLHPAQADAYGMVISEAMAAQIPVVVSNACGAAKDVCSDSGTVLPLQANLAEWVAALQLQLQRTQPPPIFVRGWDIIASEFEQIYSQYIAQEHKEDNIILIKNKQLQSCRTEQVEHDALALNSRHAAVLHKEMM